jgi:hypothetical protein
MGLGAQFVGVIAEPLGFGYCINLEVEAVVLGLTDRRRALVDRWKPLYARAEPTRRGATKPARYGLDLFGTGEGNHQINPLSRQ